MTQSKSLVYLAEDENYANALIDRQAYLLKINAIPEWLENAESPFKWLHSLKSHLQVIVYGSLADKFLDYENQGSDYGFEKYALLLTRTWDLYKRSVREDEESSSDGETEDAESSSDGETEDAESSSVGETEDAESSSEDETEGMDPEESFRKLEEVMEEMRRSEGDVMYSRIGAALEHVFTATRANMLHLQGRDEESRQVAAKIVPVENMSLENRAGFEGVKGKFIVHMYQDMSVALEVVKNAIELDPGFAYWKYLAAKIMRRHRRYLKLEMEPEELDYFEQAVALERNPKFLVFLAQANYEVAMEVFRGKTGLHPEDPKTMMERAVELFREAWQLKNDSAAIARRVGNGIMKMKNEHFDFKLAKEALHKALELSPNVVTYHALGKLYLYHAHDEEIALEYLEHAKGMFATAELIRYKLINDPDSDISKYIEYWISIAPNQVKRDIYYCEIGWYYLSVQPDIFKAVHFFWLILRRDSNSFRVLNFTSYAFAIRGPVDMLKVLVNQVLLALERYSQIPGASENCERLNGFLEKIYEKHPHLCGITPDRALLPNLRRNTLVELAKINRRLYGRSNSEGDRRNNSGNRRTEGHKTSDENQTDKKTITVQNWQTENRSDDDNRASNCQIGRNQLNTEEYGEMTSYNRRRRNGENNEQNQSGGRNPRWNERYERYNQQNRGNNEYQRNVRPDNQHEQTRGEQRERRQSYNSRYDTTVTNWRTENRS